jgi:hypothetical protein
VPLLSPGRLQLQLRETLLEFLLIRLLAVFGAEALMFLLATINIRACAKGWTQATVLTDALIAGLTFSLIKWIAETGTLAEHGAYIAGAVVGSVAGMQITRRWKDIDDHSPRLVVKKNYFQDPPELPW